MQSERVRNTTSTNTGNLDIRGDPLWTKNWTCWNTMGTLTNVYLDNVNID